MAMQVNGNYEHSRTDYAERVKEKQAAERAEKQRKQRRLQRRKNPARCPNHRMNTSAVKNREKSLQDCTG